MKRLAEGASVHSIDNNGQTLLHSAVFWGKVRIGQSGTRSLPVPLTAVLRILQIKTVRQLIKAGADVNKIDNAGATPLHLAAYGGSKQVVAVLLGEGADISAQDDHGNTPLHDVAGGMKFLKTRFHNADGGLKDRGPEPGAYYLSSSPPKTKLGPGHVNVAKLLITKGLDSGAKNNAGISPADIARELGRNTLLRAFGEVLQHKQSHLRFADAVACRGSCL